jgi:hypothetical protein
MKRYRYRSAVTGRFVTMRYADTFTKETISEEITDSGEIDRLKGIIKLMFGTISTSVNNLPVHEPRCHCRICAVHAFLSTIFLNSEIAKILKETSDG